MRDAFKATHEHVLDTSKATRTACRTRKTNWILLPDCNELIGQSLDGEVVQERRGEDRDREQETACSSAECHRPISPKALVPLAYAQTDNGFCFAYI